jgi:CBS domain containing-hemolysin-like protein
VNALTSGDLVALASAVVLLALAFFLVAAEQAINRLSVVRAQSLAEESPRSAARLEALLEAAQPTTSALRLIIIGSQIVQGVLVAVVAFRVTATAPAVAIVVADIALAFVVTEAIPRTLAILHADRVGLSAAGPVSLLLRLAPVRLVARGLIELANWVVPGQSVRGPFSIPEELVALVDAAVEDEVIEQADRDLIESVISFSDTIVRGVMVPRTDMKTVSIDDTVIEALSFASEVGFSRFPVLGENSDDVRGLLYVKDLIWAKLHDQGDGSIGDLTREPWYVPETKRAADLLGEMQQKRAHMAVVVDEYGGIAGLVTLEDLIEELVGEIVDEYDDEQSMLEPQLDGTVRVDARIPIDELNDQAGLELPQGDWDTVAGLVFDTFGRVPKRGEICEVDGYRLRVDGLRGRRITKVSVIAGPARNATREEAPYVG